MGMLAFWKRSNICVLFRSWIGKINVPWPILSGLKRIMAFVSSSFLTSAVWTKQEVKYNLKTLINSPVSNIRLQISIIRAKYNINSNQIIWDQIYELHREEESNQLVVIASCTRTHPICQNIFYDDIKLSTCNIENWNNFCSSLPDYTIRPGFIFRNGNINCSLSCSDAFRSING